MAEIPAAASSAPDDFAQRLNDFFTNNPDAKLGSDEEGAFVSEPWGDSSVQIRLRQGGEKLLAALNALFLPPRFTALWHRDSRDLELIWNPMPANMELCSRSFDFQFKGRTYHCGYAASSRRLLELAIAFRRSPPTSTDFRNLREYARYQRMKEEQPENRYVTQFTPMCFWIRDVEWDDDSVAELMLNLNFYMRYFDRQSPRIIFHDEPRATKGRAEPIRYPFGEFPAMIVGRTLDPYLLNLWEGILNAPDPFRRYIYSYQVLEYAAFYYLSEEVTQTVRRILAAPETTFRSERGARRILDAIAESKAAEEDRILAVVKRVVDPSVIWKEIEPHIEVFSQDATFDGGFCLPPLVKREWSEEDFRILGITGLAHSLRKLRNALVHGRESRLAKVVLPTRANSERLNPWLVLLLVVASLTVLYEG